jgi:hypothetical protein
LDAEIGVSPLGGGEREHRARLSGDAEIRIRLDLARAPLARSYSACPDPHALSSESGGDR